METPPITDAVVHRLLQDGDALRCIRLCDDLAACGPLPASMSVAKGRALLALEGRATDALAAFQAATAAGEAAALGAAEALLRLGRIDDAEATVGGAAAPSVRAVIAVVRDAATHGDGTDRLLLAQTFNALRNFDAAEAELTAMIADGDDRPEVWLARTRTLGGLGRLDGLLEGCRRMRDGSFSFVPNRRRYMLGEIVMLCRSLDQVRPDHALTLALLGGAQVEQTATEEEGRAFLNRANRMAEASPDVFLGAGMATLRTGQLDEARDFFARAAAGMPDFAEPAALAAALAHTDRPRRAAEALGGGANAGLLALAEGLGAAGRAGDAVDVLRGAAVRTPEVPEVHLELARMLSIRGDSVGAREAAAEARRLVPTDAAANLEMASSLMALGQLDEAWDLYDYRLQSWRKDSAMRSFDVLRWNGRPGGRSTVLVWREEGVGDELRAASVYPDLRAAHAGRLIVECNPRWRSVFARSFAGIEFRDEELSGAVPEGVDRHMPALSLFGLYRRALADFPRRPYIVPDPVRLARWRDRLAALGPEPKVGIGWKSLNPSWRKRPLLTALADWDPIVGRDDLIIVNLQCEGHGEELAAAEARLGHAIHAFSEVDLKNDLEEAVALIAALDVVIGARCWVPTTAGAVGTKAFCATPKPNPFMADLEYDPWSTATDVVYRGIDDGWQLAVERINAALDAHLAATEA